MAKSGVQANFYLGVVAEVKENFQIKADIPGVILGVNAFPLRGDCDEPKVNDPIILLGLDPDFNSYYLYWKLKENDFTGFRAYGKEISIEEEKLVIRSYSGENSDDEEHKPGEEMSKIELDKEGNITIITKKNINLNVNDTVNLNCPTIKVIGSSEVKGPGKLVINSVAVMPDAKGGPFLATNITPPQGSPLPSGKIILLGG